MYSLDGLLESYSKLRKRRYSLLESLLAEQAPPVDYSDKFRGVSKEERAILRKSLDRVSPVMPQEAYMAGNSKDGTKIQWSGGGGFIQSIAANELNSLIAWLDANAEEEQAGQESAAGPEEAPVLSDEELALLAEEEELAAEEVDMFGTYPREKQLDIVETALGRKLTGEELERFENQLQDEDDSLNMRSSHPNTALNRAMSETGKASPLPDDLRAAAKKEYLEDKFSEMKGVDTLQGDADIFFPVDVGAKYAIKALKAVFVDLPVKTYKATEKVFKSVEKEEERDIKEEKFEKELAQ